MGRVIASASMSLDGYIAKDDNTIGRLFDWLQNGEVEFPTATKGITFKVLGGLDLVARGATYTCQMTTYSGLFGPTTTRDCGAGRATGAPYLGVAVGYTP